MKGKDLGFALFMAFGTGLSAFLTYMAGHCDGWFEGYEDCAEFAKEAIDNASKIEENK
jgi:hypothetical protein